MNLSQDNSSARVVEQRVVVVDVRMKFWSMVVFLVKLAIAAIPAALILALLMALLAGVWPLLLKGMSAVVSG